MELKEAASAAVCIHLQELNKSKQRTGGLAEIYTKKMNWGGKQDDGAAAFEPALASSPKSVFVRHLS